MNKTKKTKASTRLSSVTWIVTWFLTLNVEPQRGAELARVLWLVVVYAVDIKCLTKLFSRVRDSLYHIFTLMRW